jgi:hypothetical protein
MGHFPEERISHRFATKIQKLSNYLEFVGYVLGERACQISVLCDNTRRKLIRNPIISFVSPFGVFMALPL